MKILELAIKKYGKQPQLNMAIEEMSELTKEICKYMRGNNNHDQLVEELADVYITLKQVRMICGIEDKEIAKVKREKIDRLYERILKDELHK